MGGENEIINQTVINLFKGVTGGEKKYIKSNTNGNQEFRRQ